MNQTIEDIVKIYIKDGAPMSTQCIIWSQGESVTIKIEDILNSSTGRIIGRAQFQTFTWDEGKLVFYL